MLCSKAQTQIGGTCFYYSVLNGLLLSPRINTILYRELQQYMSDIQSDKQLYQDFVGNHEVCLAKSIIDELASNNVQSKDLRFKVAKNAIMKNIRNHFKGIKSDYNDAVEEMKQFVKNVDPKQFNLQDAILPKLTLQTTKTDDIKDVRIKGGVAFSALKAILKSIYPDNQSYRNSVLILPFFENEYDELIQQVVRFTNYEMIILIQSQPNYIKPHLILNEIYKFYKATSSTINFVDFLFGEELRKTIIDHENGTKNARLNDVMELLSIGKMNSSYLFELFDMLSYYKDDIYRKELNVNTAEQLAIMKTKDAILQRITIQHPDVKSIISTATTYYLDKILTMKVKYLDYMFETLKVIMGSLDGLKDIDQFYYNLYNANSRLQKANINLISVLNEVSKYKDELIKSYNKEELPSINDGYFVKMLDILKNDSAFDRIFLYYTNPTQFEIEPFKKYNDMFTALDSKYVLDHANIQLTMPNGSNHVILGSTCDDKYVTIDQNVPSYVFDNNWTNNLDLKIFDYSGTAINVDKTKICDNCKFTFVCYVNKDIQIRRNQQGGKRYKLVKNNL